MIIIFMLIGISLTLGVGFLTLFFIAVKSNQFDDVYTPSVRILFDDNKIRSDTELQIGSKPKVAIDDQ